MIFLFFIVIIQAQKNTREPQIVSTLDPTYYPPSPPQDLPCTFPDKPLDCRNVTFEKKEYMDEILQKKERDKEWSQRVFPMPDRIVDERLQYQINKNKIIGKVIGEKTTNDTKQQVVAVTAVKIDTNRIIDESDLKSWVSPKIKLLKYTDPVQPKIVEPDVVKPFDSLYYDPRLNKTGDHLICTGLYDYDLCEKYSPCKWCWQEQQCIPNKINGVQIFCEEYLEPKMMIGP